MRHENILLFSFFALTLCSCSNKVDKEAKNNNINIDSITQHIDIVTHKQLVRAEVKYLGDGMNENFEQYEKESEKAYTKKENKDTLLIIESYFTRSGCTGYEGNISVSSDTLILKLESNTNISCTELEYYRVIYKIRNPNRKKYIIIKD